MKDLNHTYNARTPGIHTRQTMAFHFALSHTLLSHTKTLTIFLRTNYNIIKPTTYQLTKIINFQITPSTSHKTIMSARSTAPSFSSAALGPLVTIKIDIGTTILTYQVHKAIICHFSAYFERAFMDSISLKMNADITLFNIFIDWLYTGVLPSTTLSKDILLKAVAFGYNFTAPAFQAAVHNALVDLMVATRKAPSDEEVCFAFEELLADHVLLDFFAEMHCVWGSWNAQDVRERGIVPEAFCARVEKKGLRFVDLLAGPPVKACEFHVHATEEERWECRGA
jgi:hypothetical protein